MPNNDDLFAGMTVGDRKVPSIQQQAVKSAGIPESDADLFTGFTVGNVAIPEQAPLPQPVVAEPALQPADAGLTEIPPRPAVQIEPQEESPGFFETAGEFVSNLDLDTVKDLFTGASRETETSKGLPEIGAVGTGRFGSDLKIASGLLASANEEDQIDIIRSAEPNAKFFRDEKNNVVIDFPNGERSVLNQPGASFQDAVQTTANILSFLPSARLAGLGKTLLQKFGIGSFTAGATEAALQTGAQALGAEREIDTGEIATAATLGGVAEVAVPAIQGVRQARRARQVGAEAKEIEQVREAIKPAQEAAAALESATGQRVGFFPSQQTQLPSELLKQRLLPQLDAGARKAAKSLESQNKEVFDATAELLNTIAGPEVTETGAKRFRSAAQTAIQAGKDRRTVATRDLFTDALNAGADVNLTPVRAIVADSLDGAPEGGEIIKSMSRIKGFIKPRTIAGKSVQPTLRQLQKAKFEIDNMVEKFGENSLGNTTKREVLDVKRELVRQMESASPLYKQANEMFANLSPSVTELQDSIIGAISKIDDTNLQNISKRIFSAGSNPSVVKNAKAIIDKADPGAWDDMLRLELQRRFGGIETLAEDLPGDLIGNVPGQLRRAIFGNPEQRRTLLSAMNKDQRKNFVYLDEVLKRASSGRAAGSPTAPFTEALNRLKGSAGIIRDVIMRPLDTLQKTGERALFDRNVAALTEVMFNPNFTPQMKKLIKLNPDSPAAARALTQLLNSAQEKDTNNGE